ncbi:pneumococcal serine-rich repeat protein-like isoform X1 [Anastrepha ludens]|uniref:pneumococcal serine-rich repeat protein-like isoform X1 n=1 Tax=Anastrepha ludens TaxID=28586 RepID=UPI0023AEBC41|nr:pneumococcal serine-rich repeat protein-like isoform X1 [Anastrepha ludens]
MLAIKECLIREGVLNLTSTANHSNSTSLTSKQGNGAADGDGDDGGDGGIENTAVGGSGAGANNTATYRNRNYNDSVVGNNLRAISTNYTRNSDNRNNRNYDMASSLALDFQSVRLTDQISVDAARSQNTDTNNENKSSNCSLSSASATANSSCQQTSIYDKSKHLQQQKQQRVPATGSKSSTRYQGVHPHFHHHTAPSYYTDVNLHIHTPKANDVAALNENYQSVYNTPSQLVNERHFPKTSTATVVPPPIGTGTAAIGRANTTSPTSIAKRDRESVSANSSSNIKSSSSSSARAAFFRGGSVGSNSNGERKSCEHFTKSSPAFGRPTKKGEFNDTSYTPYDISGSSFVVGTLSSSDCSKTNQLDNTTDTHINTNHNNKHNSNNNISLTSPTSAGHTSASASATASASASASASGRSRNSNRFAGKKRAVRVRSESRPISALYDIICKEKGLDIGTSSSSSTTNEEEHSASASNDDENRGAHSKRSTNSKERCRQRSGSRNSNRNNSTDYSEISHRLPAFVAKSLSNHSGEFVGQSNMDNVATVNSAAVDTKAAHDRSKRSHKSRTPSSQKSASKKRKDVGKTKVSVMRCAMSDDEPNNETSEDSNELRARAVLSPLTKYHTEFSHKMNSTEKASSLPPRLQSATRTSSSSVKQALQPHKASCHANTDLSTYPIVKKCPVHSRCDLVDCDYQLSSVHRPSHYTHAHHQSSLPPNLSSGPCSSIRSPSTADDDSLMVVNSLGYSPDKLFFEPVNMTLSSVSSGAVSGKNVNSSSSGVVFDQTSARSNQRIGRAQHRRLREEMRRHTDLPLLDMLSPNSLSSQLSTTERALSEDEGVAGVKQQKSRTSKARRFINRPSHTPTHGRSGNSANGSPHPIRRNSNKQTSESSSSASSPAPTNRRNSSANGINSINRPTVVPPINTVAAVAGVTIEDVGSASSGDHLTHIKLSPLQIMTNSATPATELPPRANGSAALGEGEAHPAEADMHDEAHEDTGNGSIGVQTIISATEVVHQRKHDANTHKTPPNTIIRSITKTTTSTITSAIISNKTPTHVNQRNQQHYQHQQQQPYNKSNKHTSFFSHNNSTFNSNSNSNSNNSYAMPTETFLLKQKNAMLAVSGAATNTNVKKKPLSPLQIIPIPTSPTTAHQLSHQQHSQSTDVGGSQQQSGYLTQMPPNRRQSPLAAAPPSPFSLARSPLSPCSPHYVRPTKASRLRAAALDKKKCEDDPLQRPRSPCYGSASSPRSSASPKHQLSRLSTSSSSDNPHITASSESDTKLIGDSSRATIGSLYSTSSNDSPTATKKLVPSVSVSVKQNLSEMQFNGDISASGSPKKTIGSRLKKARTIPSPSTECTATFTRSAGRLSTADESDSHLMLKAGKSIRPRTSTMKSAKSKSISDLKASSAENSPNKLELSPVDSATQPSSPREDRDKSSKRKSNLNRSLNDEATLDSVINLKYLLLTARLRKNKLFLNDSLAARRRRRRELGMVRQLVPSDDLILREMLLPHQKKSDSAAKKTPIGKSSENELAYHMEMARRGWDLTNPSINNRARSETATSKYESNSGETVKEKPSNARLARRSDTLHLGELRKLRSNDVNRKMNERTKSDLAEIKKIAEQANIEMAMMTSGIVTELAELVVSSVDCEQEAVVELATPARYGIGSRSQASPPPTPSFTELEMAAEAKERDPSPAKHATFMQEERFYYDPETSDQISKSVSNNTMASGILRQRILKARSIERDAAHEPPKLSPILRRKSTDDPPCITAPPTSAAGIYSTSQNHIVSILKKKDHIAGESSSASSNASPVTFSANVVDTPTTKQKRAGILKKRSSLDESRYYSRSHSPDERSILIKSARRNSLEETAGLQQQQQQQQHGILKQSSYESSKSDGCPSATEPHPHSILKKKDSTSTPSDGGTHAPKHVSISQAVKMAAAELCRQTADGQCATTEHEESGYTPNNEEYEIRPILKLESASSDDVMRPPKPILKKKSSGDSDEYEIRPILKTSRKSSREEFDLSGSLSEDGRHYSEPPPPPPVRPILKTDSPSKRRSLGIDELEQDASSAEYVSNSPSLLKRRTRSLERQEPPVVDLAAALNAIATSQAAPLDFVSTPITTGGNISVAERIKNMEKFLSSNGASPSTPADVNSSWDSPLLHTDITPRLLKPSVIRRDMYRDRYKTQPVTNDEKMLFKATASPLDISVTSAFKPTKSLDAGLNYTAFAHSNAASNASLGSSYTLTRCSTQSLHGQNHFDAAGTSSVGSPPLRAVIGRLNSLSDRYNNSGSEQLTHWVGSDSERIFEMSGIEENAAAAAASTLNDKSEVGVGVGGTGLARKNSVRARANMFQQLQEKTKSEEAATAESSASTATTFNREEQTSPRRAPRQLSPTPTMFATPPILSSSMASAANASCSEEHKTPQVPTRTEEEIEPTSLPVSERLRFFANLTEAANRSLSSSYTRSPSQRHLTADRCGSANSYNHIHSITNTPRSSYNGGGSTTTSSASVTPTPMDCYSPPLSEPQLISINEIDSALQMEHNFDETAPSPLPSEPVPNATTHETSAFIKLSKSSSHTSLSSVVAQRLALSVPAPVVGPSALTPVARRIKMKTIGKLHLPQTFLNNDHNSSQSSSNNNHNISNNSIGNVYSDTCDSECSSIEAVSKPPAAPLKKIGKIKSPFIENCLQMEQKHHQLNSKYMKYDHKSTPHNALAALENNVANSGGGERDMNSLPQRKPLQNGNASLPPQRVDSNEDSNTDSGKENNYGGIKTVPLLTISPTASLIALTEQSHSPVVEMRKKFTRIMNGSSLSTVSQRLSAHAYHTDNGSVNGKGNGNGNNSGVSSAPTTPRNSMIDEKYAKYFGLTSNNSHSQNCATTTTNKTSTCKESSERARTQHSANNARLQFAGEKTAGPRHAPNYPPPPPPPLDFYHTTNGETHCPSKAKDELIVAMETNSGYDVHLTPFEAINHNVRSNSNTPYYTPPTTMPLPMTGNTLTAYNTAVHTTPSGIANVPQRRRDIAKRQRANTTNVTFTPTSSQVPSPHANFGTPSAGRARTLRTRALTLTHGMPLPEVKRFEDIVVTKEDFQLASKEFERIFLGII